VVYAVHQRLTFSGVRGTVASPREQWSFRINMRETTGGTTGSPTVAQLDAIGASWQAKFSSRTTSDTILTSVKHAVINTDGKYLGNNPPTLSSALSLAGGATPLKYPDQVALAVSLITAERGGSGRGRFYLAGPSMPLVAGGVIDPAEALATADLAAQFLKGLETAWPGAADVCIASSKGRNINVTAVRVGRVYDTIRSRRTSLPEAYQVSTNAV
jgi:hypothetical protein